MKTYGLISVLIIVFTGATLAQRGDITIPVGSHVKIPLGAQLCADTFYVYGTLEAADYSGVCATSKVYCYGTCIPPDLPVELLSLAAYLHEGRVYLRWATATEENNYGFDVERSVVSRSTGWNKVGFVPGSGTTTELRRYEFEDDLSTVIPYSGVIYYRLRQVDTDGKYTYSPVVEVSLSNAPKVVRLSPSYPNPVRDVMTLEWYLPRSSTVSLSLYDLQGREVARIREAEPEEWGFHALRASVGNLPSGMYNLILQAGETRLSQVVVVQH
ncbi:MAG: T9SS type A sorting domain-containing protein [Chlorobi bacterium]|nr:T9SS type A sorting domain-containing protein [Chlorobiota bacterium]